MSIFGMIFLVSCMLTVAFSLPIDNKFSVMQNDQSISSNSSISISFHATGLKGCDRNSACDASITIICASIDSDWKQCGQTNITWNNNNPIWPEVFTFEHVYGTHQRWRFDLKEHHLIGTKFMGIFYYTVDDYADSKEKLIQMEVPNNRGILWLQRVDENINAK